VSSVYFNKARNKYAAQISRDGVRRHIGLFKTLDEAQKVARECEAGLPQRNPVASKPTEKELTQSRAKELFDYDPVTGALTWKARTSRRISVGDVAGHNTCQGYIAVRVDRDLLLAHRVIWMYVHGRFPCGDLDHIDGNGRNNALHNLRECNRPENLQNTTLRKDNKLGVTGVYKALDTGKFKAEITAYGIKKRLGSFDSVDQARAAYVRAKKVMHTFNPIQRESSV
jgi:hypothetical protein